MKILMVNKFLYPRGGAETYALKLAEELTRLGHEVQFFGMYDEKNTVSNRLGLYTSNMDFHSSSLSRFLYPFKIVYSFEAKKKIGQVLDDFKPDVVHMNNINFQLTPSIIDAVKKRHIPLVQTVHDFQMVCPNHLLYDFTKQAPCENCVGHGKFPCIKGKCIHNSRVKSIIGAVEARFYRIKGTYKKVDSYICPSRFLEGRLLADNPSLFQGKTVAIHNFIEKPEIKEAKRNYDFPYVAFAGRLSAEKGLRLLAEAVRLLPDVKFVVMGNGPEEHAFDGLPNVTMTGFLTGDTLRNNIANAEVSVVSSIWYENCPLSILEAQSMGVPVVTMPLGGMAELVEDGVTGFLADEVTAESLAAAIRRALSDPDKLAAMKQTCQEKSDALVLTEYTQKILDIYDAVTQACRK